MSPSLVCPWLFLVAMFRPGFFQTLSKYSKRGGCYYLGCIWQCGSWWHPWSLPFWPAYSHLMASCWSPYCHLMPSWRSPPGQLMVISWPADGHLMAADGHLMASWWSPHSQLTVTHGQHLVAADGHGQLMVTSWPADGHFMACWWSPNG